ncbi:MAG TPA: DUF4919 domain-containing protein [Flavipsychrobacter sp.]|nr:DUF4919 domain-containing protein [Flavipsychrobacter sp.]
MLRKMVLVFWMSVIAVSVFGQEHNHIIPDYTEIEKLTKDKSSAFYYDGLFKRYKANDSTLTLRDYRMLYYGHFFQADYSPFYHTEESDSIKILLGGKEELDNEDWKEVIRLGTANVNKNPFDLKGLNVVWIAHQHMGDSAVAKIYFDKLKNLVQTILATGDGLSEQTAIHVVNVSHEYDILNILGYEFGGAQKLTDGKCDFLSLKTNDDKIDGLYFDVKQIFKGYEQHGISSTAP